MFVVGVYDSNACRDTLVCRKVATWAAVSAATVTDTQRSVTTLDAVWSVSIHQLCE